MPIDWDTYTNDDLDAVNPATLSADDLQTFREEMIDRGLSTIPPPVQPSTPALTANFVTLQSPDGVTYTLGVDDDGSLRTINFGDPSLQRLHVTVPDGIADGQILVYDSVTGEMVPGWLPGARVVPGDVLTDDSAADLPLNAEDGTSWVQADTLPDWLVSELTNETLTNEANTLALTQG